MLVVEHSQKTVILDWNFISGISLKENGAYNTLTIILSSGRTHKVHHPKLTNGDVMYLNDVSTAMLERYTMWKIKESQ